MDSKLLEVYKKGKYYNPAKSHHSSNYDSDEEINVICDRCQMNNLTISIGYKDLDLCMRCVDAIREMEEKKDNQISRLCEKSEKLANSALTLMKQNKFGTSGTVSKIRELLGKNDRPVTKMRQKMYSSDSIDESD